MNSFSPTTTAAPRRILLLLAILSLASLPIRIGYTEQPPPPCHPNPRASVDREIVANRDDVRQLPVSLKDRLVRLADRPHTVLPLQVFAEADNSSQLFQYYLLDTTGFEPNVFTTRFPGVNDAVQLTVTGANCGLPTIGTVRVVLEPKPGLPTDPNNPPEASGGTRRRPNDAARTPRTQPTCRWAPSIARWLPPRTEPGRPQWRWRSSTDWVAAT